MGTVLHMPRISRKMQRTLKNLRVSVLCFLLTFLVLRNTVGAGKFGTPAQDFEEIRQHLHYVGLRRGHFRVLAEVVEEEEKHKEDPMLAPEKSPLPEEGVSQKIMLLRLEGDQGGAPIARQGSTPLRPQQGGLSQGNAGGQKEEAKIRQWGEHRRMGDVLAHGSYKGPRILLLTGMGSFGCKSPAGEHFLLKSLKNKVDYTTLHGFDISPSFGGLDPDMAKPLSKLSLLQRTMIKHPNVEWLWWMPNEAVITDMRFKLPLHNYTEFNLVLLGSDEKTHPQKSINLDTDTFLIRKCQWSIDLLHAAVHAGTLEGEQTDRLLTNSMIRVPHMGASEQSAVISLLNQKNLSKNLVMDAAVRRESWRDAVQQLQRIVNQSNRGIGDKGLPFVMQFIGCNVCQKGGNGEGEMCVKQLERALTFAEKQSKQSHMLHPRNLASS